MKLSPRQIEMLEASARHPGRRSLPVRDSPAAAPPARTDVQSVEPPPADAKQEGSSDRG
jgi:hypothetical protein